MLKNSADIFYQVVINTISISNTKQEERSHIFESKGARAPKMILGPFCKMGAKPYFCKKWRGHPRAW